MNVKMRAPRERRSRAVMAIQLGETALGGRSPGDAGRADEIEVWRGLVVDGETSDRRRRLSCDLRDGLRNRGVANVAELAVVFVVGVAVPVADGVGGQKRQRQNRRDGEQAP